MITQRKIYQICRSEMQKNNAIGLAKIHKCEDKILFYLLKNDLGVDLTVFKKIVAKIKAEFGYKASMLTMGDPNINNVQALFFI